MCPGYSGFNLQSWNCRQDSQGLRNITSFGREIARVASKEFVLEFLASFPPQEPAGAAFKQWTVCPLIQVARNFSALLNVLYPVGGIAALSMNHGAEENFRGVILYGCYSVRVNNRKSNVRTLSWLEASDYPSTSFLPISTITFKTSFPSSSLVLPAVSKACGTHSRL